MTRPAEHQRIAIVIESLGGGGAQHVASAVANALQLDGHQVTVITMQGPEADAFALDSGIHRVVMGGDGASRSIAQALGANVRRVLTLRRAIRESEAQLVLSFVGTMNILTILATRGMGKKVVISERNDPTRQSLGRLWDGLRKITYRWADFVTANSNDALDGMAGYVPRRKLRWVPNPLRQPSDVTSRLTLPAPSILAVGRLNRQKGFDILLNAFAEFQAQFTDWRLIILGEGAERDALEEQAKRLHLADRVDFKGFDDPFPYYRSARMMAHPARFEGVPNAVLEAMSCGLPVIVTEGQRGLSDWLRHEETALIVPVDSAGALAIAMARLANDPGYAQTLGQAGQAAMEPFAPVHALNTWRDTILDEPSA